jgi:hypothetical protein
MKGKIFWNQQDKKKYIELEDGSKQPLPKGLYKDNIEKGQKVDVEYEIENGKIMLKTESSKNKAEENYVGAPYNFIPLNETPVPGQDIPYREFERNGKKEKEVIVFSKYFDDRFSGYIDLNITTKTPIFIRGNGSDFLNIEFNAKKPILPGSSLRGLIRTLVEIASFGKFINYKNKNFYRRSSLTSDGDNVLSGFLNFSNGKYDISSAKCDRMIKNSQKQGIAQPHVYKEVNGDVFFSVGEFMNNVTVWKFSSVLGGSIPVTEDIIESYVTDDQRDNGVVDLILSLKKNNIRNKKDKIINNSSYNLTKGIPVFYRTDKSGRVISIGHAKYHRIPYKHDVDRFVPDALKNGLDFAESIFGITEFSGRVFFEDAITDSGDPYLNSTAIQPKILASPKPTTYQHYLKQNGKPLKDWSSANTPIRGYKLYWHRNTPADKTKYSWVEEDNKWKDAAGNKKESYPDPIRPLKSNLTFISRIRFENLTPEELGCLLFVLKLPDGCCHKLGMGKPLGLGSVAITPTLVLHNRKERYATLFDDTGWYEPVLDTTNNPNRMEDFTEKFERYILDRISSKDKGGSGSLWDTPRLKELKTMLTFDQGVDNNAWLEATRYMEIERMTPQGKKNEYENRPVLPMPTEVIKIAKNN